MTTADSSLFENLSFNPFNFESILLNNIQDPDENLTENFIDCSYFTPNELKDTLGIPHKSFSIISFNIRSMKKSLTSLRIL